MSLQCNGWSKDQRQEHHLGAPEKRSTLRCTLMFIAALFTIVRTQKQPRWLSTEEWVKMCYLYTMKCCFSVSKSCPTLCNPMNCIAPPGSSVHGVQEYYSGIKRNKIMPFFSDMDAPRECHTEWSNSEREIQISYNIAYMWNLEKLYRWTYLQSRNRDTDLE